MLIAATPRLPVLVPPHRWKGNLTKRQTRNRVVRALGKTYATLNEHELDAVAMGVSAQGAL